MRYLIGRIIACVVLFAAVGTAQLVNAQGRWPHSGDWRRRLGVVEVETAEATKEASLALLSASIDQAIEKKRLEALQRPEIKKAFEAAQAASREYEKQMLAMEEYQQLSSRKTELLAKVTPKPRTDFKDQKAYGEYIRGFIRDNTVRDAHKELAEVSGKMSDFIRDNEQLKPYKAKEDEAWVAAISAVKTVLEADEEVKKLQAERETIQEVQRLVHNEKLQKLTQQNRHRVRRPRHNRGQKDENPPNDWPDEKPPVGL